MKRKVKKRPFLENKTQVFALSHLNALVHYVTQNTAELLTKLVQFVPTGKLLPSFFIPALTMNTCLRRSLRSITFISSRDHYKEEQFHPD